LFRKNFFCISGLPVEELGDRDVFRPRLGGGCFEFLPRQIVLVVLIGIDPAAAVLVVLTGAVQEVVRETAGVLVQSEEIAQLVLGEIVGHALVALGKKKSF